MTMQDLKEKTLATERKYTAYMLPTAATTPWRER